MFLGTPHDWGKLNYSTVIVRKNIENVTVMEGDYGNEVAS